MAASVFVSDEHALDISLGVAELRLANLVRDGQLAAASHVAYQGSIDLLVRVGPFGDMPGVSRLVRVQFVDPVYRDGAMTVGVRWEAAGAAGGLFPVLDANIRLSGQRRPEQPDGPDRLLPASAWDHRRRAGPAGLA
jgi:hypothetical protein